MGTRVRIQRKDPFICTGDLREQIVLEYGAEASVGGNVERTWTTLATVWSMMVPIPTEATEMYQVKLGFPVSHKFYIRYRSDVTVHNRVKYGTRYFDIRAVTNLGNNDTWLELITEERE